MSLRRRLFLTLCLVVLLGFFSIAKWVRGELRNSYAQVAEEILVDNAHLFAAHLENNRLSKESLRELEKMFATYKEHSFQAQIFDITKVQPTLDMYVTDARGVVIASSKSEQEGHDFSNWNDVYRTLQGQYGARSTRLDRQDSRTSVYFVAAPIRFDSQIQGSLTISKTENSILLFLDQALNRMFLGALYAVIVLGLIGGLILVWISWPLEKLRKYALDISEGRRSSLPQTQIKEVRELGEAFEKMRISLEGKKTIEKYTESLTHELKSPLTAIQGAAELCLEEMDSSQRNRFLQNIIEESARSHSLLEQLLKIAALESRHHLEQSQIFDPVEVLNEAKEALLGVWKPKLIQIQLQAPPTAKIEGDRFLLFQAFRNLLQNSLDFSKPQSEIQISVSENAKDLRIEIRDQGAGIPDFAKERIFEKFYSLERPDTKRKSSGLGLSFVKEVIELHHGKIHVDSLGLGLGTLVTLTFPRSG